MMKNNIPKQLKKAPKMTSKQFAKLLPLIVAIVMIVVAFSCSKCVTSEKKVNKVEKSNSGKDSSISPCPPTC